MSIPLSPVAEEATGQATPARLLPIRFTGSGSEYFRIWVVNLLLILCTLGLYYPFAKARRLVYFHGNTLIDGQALGFHGNPRKMLRGFLLMVALGGVYSWAGRYSPLAALVALVVVAVIWPALWRAALQFRLANTSWRGLRFSFTGSLEGAYKAIAPAFVPGLLMVAAGFLAPQPEAGPNPAHGAQFAWAFGVVALGSLLAAPFLLWAIKRYQHGHYQLASQRSHFDAGPGAVYKLSLGSMALAFVSLLLSMVVVGGLMYLVFRQGLSINSTKGQVVMAAGMLLGYLLSFIVPWPYWTARLQNLVWNHTRSAQLRFHSTLSARALLVLTLKNLLLTLLTLGLYRPFAAVATARLRLESMTVALEGEAAPWEADLDAAFARDASGDLAGDFFGIDLGL